MKVLLDCDVLLDVATARMPFVKASRAVLDWCQRNPASGVIAWHSVANLYYLLRKSHDEASKRQFIGDLLFFVEVAPAGTADAKHALLLPMSDFEDALQSAAAVGAGADYIITRNLPHYRSSLIPAILPADFLSMR